LIESFINESAHTLSTVTGGLLLGLLCVVDHKLQCELIYMYAHVDTCRTNDARI